MFLRRQFTIMIVPDAQGRMKRLHVRGTQIAAAVGALALVTCLAISAPMFLLWNRGMSNELSSVQQERDLLAQRSAEVEVALSTVRQRLSQFEDRTSKLATIAGLELPTLGPNGQGRGAGFDGLEATQQADLLSGEADDLSDRSALVERRLATVESAIGEQSDRLERIPSVLPVRGLVGAGFAWRRDPFTGRRQFHRGLDISAPEGTPIHAPAAGVVVKSERHSGYGKVLYISHGDGIVTRYGHLSEYRAKPGQKIARGDVVGLVGSTGRSTAPHLHYEVLLHGKQVDPMQYIMDDALFY